MRRSAVPLRIKRVISGSPADRAGLKVGDIILTANGERIDDESSLVELLEDLRPGDVVNVKAIRDRRQIDLSLRLERPAP